MMSSNQGRSLINPLVQSKMEGAIGTIIPPGLPKADRLSHYSHDKALPIPRGYFSYPLNGQDALDFNSLWDSSKTCIRNGSSPGIYPSATEGIYRPENLSFPMDAGGRSVGPQELAVKQRLAYYANSPRHHSPRAPGVISPVGAPKGHIGGSGISSTDGEGCVGLAVPKPVYGHSPCCTERGCTAGHTYADEHGPHRMSPRVYEDEWAAHFSRLAYLHKKGQEALAQQRVLHLEHGVEGIPLKDGKTVGYHGIRSNGPGRSLPLMEPSHSSYSYNTHQFIGSTSEYCQRAPVPQQIHRGLPTGYDPRTLTHHSVSSKVYQERPHISKYTQIPPCSSVYYPQSQMEAYRADPNVITDDHARQHHMAHFHSPRPNFTNMPTSCPVVPPHHPLIPKFPSYPLYGVRLNGNQTPLHEKQCPPLPMHQSERPLDFSARRVQTPDSPRELCRRSGTPGAFHPTSGHYRRPNSTAAERTEGAGTGFVADGCKDFTNIPKSHEEQFKKRHRGETESDSEVDASSKKQKAEIASERPDQPQSPCFPPMPVIKKVFSLAPYKIYFEATGMLQSQGNSKSPQPEATQLKQEPNIQNRDIEANSGENDLSLKPDASPANSNGLFGVDEIVKIKKEKTDPDETAYQSEMKVCVIEEMNHSFSVKEEQRELDSSISGSVPDQIVIKSDVEEDSNPPLEEKSESSACKTAHAVENGVGSDPVPTLPSTSPVQPPLTKFSLDKIPLHCLKLSNYKIVLPEVLKAPAPQPVELPQSPVEGKPTTSSKQARHQFMELHQSLCRLLYTFVTRTPCQELRDWLCKMDLRESVSHSSKAQRVSCLIGSKIREVWLKNEEMVMTLQKVVCQLHSYIESHKCPFPHVMRAGTVFIPMLVVKEVLFPQVQGAFIDQVLQEHRVELRPTTLSEERQLTQLHRKAFSSKLRRLLSLKHLPDIYPDVLNLLYYASVCKYLGAKTNLTFKRECTDSSDDFTMRMNSPDEFYLKSSTVTTPETTCVDTLENRYCLKTKKGRVKISSKRRFLEETSSSQEEDFAEEPQRWTIVNTFETEEWEVFPVASNEREGRVEVKIEDETLDIATWRRPLTSDDFSESSDEETESTSCLSYKSNRSSSAESRGLSKGSSSMVLKLRKVFFNEGHRGRVTHYQKVTNTLEAQGGLRGHDRFRTVNGDHYRKKKHESSRHKRHHTDRLHSSYSQNCSYVSKKHNSKLMRRWVLRSAAQSACLAVENRYPDLVGKRIRHLYEENDKTEVWYRGVVLRIHEPHRNPLKTVFEVKYDSEPEWRYYLELLLDHKKGWLKVED